MLIGVLWFKFNICDGGTFWANSRLSYNAETLKGSSQSPTLTGYTNAKALKPSSAVCKAVSKTTL